MIYLYYFLFINFLSAIICIADKKKAKKGNFRISERTLFLLCILGGCPAMYITMRIIRHKTRHKRFMVGIPIIFILQCVIIIYLLTR